jgi:hypothetical protein
MAIDYQRIGEEAAVPVASHWGVLEFDVWISSKHASEVE